MKKHYISTALLAAAVCLASCGSDSESIAPAPAEQGTPGQEQPTHDAEKVLMTFHAGYAGDESAATSKTAIGDTENKKTGLLFSAGDKINVNSCTFQNDLTEKPAATCNFTGYTTASGPYHAVYPSSATFGKDLASISASIPSTQTAVAGTFDPSAHIMVATEEDGSFLFETAIAFLKFTAPCDLKELRIDAGNGEKIAGNITITSKDGGYADFTVSAGSSSSITLSGTIDEGSTYYIAYVPGYFENGLKLSLVNKSSQVATHTTKSFTSTRNRVTTIGGLSDLTYTNKIYSKDLDAYLQKCSASEVATVYLADYDNAYNHDNGDYGVINKALQNNDTKKVKLILPESVTSIGNYAFYGCSSLVNISMPNVTSIGAYAFNGCGSLALTELPSGVTSIGAYAFYGCGSLVLTELPSGVTSIESNAFFGCSSLSLTELPSGVTSIEPSVFDGCGSLALTELPSGVTSIGSNAFNGCGSLALTELPSGVTSIGGGAFEGCSSLALTELPSGVTSIGNTAFDGCRSLALTELPSGVTSIGFYAFSGCSNIEKLEILGDIKEFGGLVKEMCIVFGYRTKNPINVYVTPATYKTINEVYKDDDGNFAGIDEYSSKGVNIIVPKTGGNAEVEGTQPGDKIN